MKSPTEQLIDLVERLRPTGEIGDGMVAELHDLAARARVELCGYVYGAEGVATCAGMKLPPAPLKPQ